MQNLEIGSLYKVYHAVLFPVGYIGLFLGYCDTDNFYISDRGLQFLINGNIEIFSYNNYSLKVEKIS